MINIKQLTQEDIGRNVMYKTQNVFSEGVITPFNDTYVFVRYGVCGCGQATNPNDLTFEQGH
ncbi:hypothetical protein NVP1063O_099 [Vibrio phage 1.063.O._10N.261.45.C7]|nr:hypothetical protein NVP1063O_099 [Vibrio phage 1.063.O._10N.261.45.C7]